MVVAAEHGLRHRFGDKLAIIANCCNGSCGGTWVATARSGGGAGGGVAPARARGQGRRYQFAVLIVCRAGQSLSYRHPVFSVPDTVFSCLTSGIKFPGNFPSDPAPEIPDPDPRKYPLQTLEKQPN